MKKTWWKEAVIYQIYPRSFMDANGDGIGDLLGIIQKLDYIKDLGVDVIWLSPVYQSPNDDNGYDISDYYDIMTEFGTLGDFDELLDKVHLRGMKLVMDLVVNHTSDAHPWFQAARQSKDSPYRDFYFWAPEPPCNWPAFFGGPAWTYDEVAGEYFLHLFSSRQPDLNWENPQVRQEVYRLMRFWLDKGIDGFRMDVIPLISKRTDWPDVDLNNFTEAIEKTYANGPRVHEFLQEMHREVLRHYDIMTVGEAPGVPPRFGSLYVGEDRNELNMIFHFGHMFLDWGPRGKFDPQPWDLNAFKDVFNTWDAAIGDRGWLSPFLDNHDFPRMVSRWGNDKAYRVPSAKMLATLLLTMRGTPSIYMGSELGMTNVAFPSFDDYRDLETLNAYREVKARGGDLDALLRAVHQQSRDNMRTPMQWDGAHHAGFTEAGEPWIPVNPNYTEINAEKVLADPDSVFHYYRRLLQLRKAHPTLIYGRYEMIDEGSEVLYAYRRWDEAGEYFVYLNFSDEEQELTPRPAGKDWSLLIGNYDGETARLRPWEGRVYQVTA